MADSIQEQIIKKIYLAMSEITTTNGYENTLVSVQRLNQNGIDLANVPALLVREGSCEPDMSKSPFPFVQRRMEMVLVVVTRQDDTASSTDARSGAEQLNSLVADVETRLAASRNWDGLASDTEPPSYLEVEVESIVPHLARGMQFGVTYRHLRTNPYSALAPS